MVGFRTTPAGIWRAFFMSVALAIVPIAMGANARSTSRPPLLQTGKADPAEAKAALEQMRQLGIAGDYFLEFELRVLPRRGEERVIRGGWWGTRNSTGPISRVHLRVPDEKGRVVERRLLIQNGEQAAVWRAEADGRVAMLGGSTLFEPVVPGADLTVFDLQMPFIYWNDFTSEGLARFRGRPAHVLVMRPPNEFAAKNPQLKAVRVHLDTQFNALVQTELLDASGEVTKTLSVVDLKKFDDQWIVKTIDVRDETTRNKTRFTVTAAGLGLDFSGVIFQPAQLAAELNPPPETQLVRVEP